jgi:hypothetical protein
MEHALRHVLSEQQRLLERTDCAELSPVVKALSALASNTISLVAAGFNQPGATSSLTREAAALEKLADNLSKELWTPIQVSVAAIYKKIEASFVTKPGELGFVAEVRAHYHNLRLRLLEQMLGARMLALSSDLGDEAERIWQQFLERQLGPMFRVLRGGYICDHKGNKSCQIDLIVVPADAQVFVPGDSEGGKAHVLSDQVISALMVTSNLTATKLREDWRKLQSLPQYIQQDDDYPHLKGHPWPLCYILAAQSDASSQLIDAWKHFGRDEIPSVVPQFVVTLDSGFFYCGLRKWPAPTFPSNYKTIDDLHYVSGIYAGLGLAWLITQVHGRLAAIQKQSIERVSRFAKMLDVAMLQDALPPTWSSRFWTMLRDSKLGGIMEWGSVEDWVHNGIQLQSLARLRDGAKTRGEVEVLQNGAIPSDRNWQKYVRWFRYPAANVKGRLLAVEEWLNHKSKTGHNTRTVVFDIESGDEISGPAVDALESAYDNDGLARVEATRFKNSTSSNVSSRNAANTMQPENGA